MSRLPRTVVYFDVTRSLRRTLGVSAEKKTKNGIGELGLHRVTDVFNFAPFTSKLIFKIRFQMLRAVFRCGCM